MVALIQNVCIQILTWVGGLNFILYLVRLCLKH